MKSVAPLTLSVSFKPSHRLLLIQAVAHATAGGAVLVATVPPWLAAILLILVGASWVHQRRRPVAVGLALGGDGRIQIVGADGTANEAEVHPHTLVTSFLVVLLYRQDRQLRSLTLLSDSLEREEFRQMRLWLRWRKPSPQPG